jgi:hypothetical protein
LTEAAEVTTDRALPALRVRGALVRLALGMLALASLPACGELHSARADAGPDAEATDVGGGAPAKPEGPDSATPDSSDAALPDAREAALPDAPDAALPDAAADVPAADAPTDASSETFDATPLTPRSADLGRLLLWLDASEPSSVLLTESGRVAVWADLSGNGQDARQTNSDQMPVLRRAALGGRAVIALDPTQSLRLDDYPGLKVPSLTLFIVCRSLVEHANVIGYPILNAAGDDVVPPYWRWSFFHVVGDRMGVGIGTSNSGPPSVVNTRWRVHNVYSYRSWTRDLYRNGRAFYVGEREVAIEYPPAGPGLLLGSLRFEGELAEILIYDGTLSNPAREKVERYLAGRWGIPPE